jgi:alpha-beta hydrolase superfamily lysophospholipase
MPLICICQSLALFYGHESPRSDEHSQLQVNSARLYYEVRGTGPPLLLIPGGTVDSNHFTAVADLLAAQFRTVTYDRRGNGNSPRPASWQATSLAEQADDAAGLVQALGLATCTVWGEPGRRHPARAAYPPTRAGPRGAGSRTPAVHGAQRR